MAVVAVALVEAAAAAEVVVVEVVALNVAL